MKTKNYNDIKANKELIGDVVKAYAHLQDHQDRSGNKYTAVRKELAADLGITKGTVDNIMKRATTGEYGDNLQSLTEKASKRYDGSISKNIHYDRTVLGRTFKQIAKDYGMHRSTASKKFKEAKQEYDAKTLSINNGENNIVNLTDFFPTKQVGGAQYDTTKNSLEKAADVAVEWQKTPLKPKSTWLSSLQDRALTVGATVLGYHATDYFVDAST